MIKDKFTPELKKVISSVIDISEKRNKERGFLLCEDNKTGKLFSSKICEGTTCELPNDELLEGVAFCVHNNADVVGNFHTHPYVININMRNIKEGKPKKSASEIKKGFEIGYKKIYDSLGIKIPVSVLVPSHTDLVNSINFVCRGEGPMYNKIEIKCIGSDLDKERIECWTTNNEKINKDNCDLAEEDIKPENYEKRKKNRLKKFNTDHVPDPWIIPLFEIETIDLK